MFKLYVIQCLKGEGTEYDMDAIQKQHCTAKKNIVLKTFLIKRSKTANFSQNRLFKRNIMDFWHRISQAKGFGCKIYFVYFAVQYYD